MPSISFEYHVDEDRIIGKEKEKIMTTVAVSDIFDYVLNEGEYRLINQTKSD
jgi:hypothetical protein